MARDVSGFCASSHAVIPTHFLNPVGIRTFCIGMRSPVKLVVYSLLYAILLIVSCKNPGSLPYFAGIFSVFLHRTKDKAVFVERD